MRRTLAPALAAAALTAAAAPARTNEWAAAIAVTQSAASVRISAISVNALPDGRVLVAVSWTWHDAQGAAVRSGVSRYSQEQLDARLRDRGVSVDALRALLLAVAREEAAR